MDDDYQFGTSQTLPLGRDKREDYRLTARARAWIQRETPEPGTCSADRAAEKTVECQIRDISARGLSLASTEAFNLSSLLMAEVSLGHRSERYKLMVEVMWCRQTDEGYQVGIRVQESDETDYLDWIDAVATALADG
ncbi:PilZ domain-containing protein [Marinobacter sp.]|uniref:PilZ domain-containing protein n=1 Tax=Marinobacter sp. TaxID=50741 RepID=UPI0025C655BD|nr:PilZ domain-containing protein [Marinobacter sp.]